jgi:hypothetical protein
MRLRSSCGEQGSALDRTEPFEPGLDTVMIMVVNVVTQFFLKLFCHAGVVNSPMKKGIPSEAGLSLVSPAAENHRKRRIQRALRKKTKKSCNF